jgi:AraC family transcriptional regulator
MAEVQCFEADYYGDGLRNYKRLAVEFPDSLPPSNHWTYRTDAPPCGKDQLAWDIYRAMVVNASSSHGVKSMFDENFKEVKNNPVIEEVTLLVQGTNTSIQKESRQVEPKIVTRKEMILVGMESDDSYIHGLWMKYEEKEKDIKHKVEGTAYEWHRWDLHKCIVATEVTEVEAIPEGMSVMRLPAGQYAVFTHRLANGGYGGLNSVMSDWLATGPYEDIDGVFIQVFDQRFKGGNQPDSEIDFLIPVKPKA